MANGLDTLRIGGHYVLVGAAFPSPPISVDPEKVIRRLLTLQGIHNYIPADLKYAVDFLKNHYRQFSFDTLVARKFALADAQAAFEYASEHRPLRIAVVP